MGNNRSGWLVAVVFLGVVLAIAGGALMGGVVGYYVARSNTLPAPVAASAQTVSATLPPAAPAVSNLTLTEDSAVTEAVKKVGPSVVTVVNTLTRGATGPQGNRITPQASGSGVVIDAKGYIITNNHVVEGARTLDVIFQDGSKATAKLIGGDAVSDIAVIQADRAPAVAAFGDSNALQLGQTVIAIGSPLGSYPGSVTVGVVSGMHRRVDPTGQENLIQTDAAINHGNSGGPLVNTAGQIIGINTLVVRDTNSGDIAEGLGFAVPANTVRQVADQLIANGRIEYPFIGIQYAEITPQVASENNLAVQDGVLVTASQQNTPASEAGVKQGDIVRAINGEKIDASHSLRQLLFKYKPGDKVTLGLLRGTQSLEVSVTLVARPNGG